MSDSRKYIPEYVQRSRAALLRVFRFSASTVMRALQGPKSPDWKEWAYTDGSCHIHLGRQVIGAGVYHHDNDSPKHVQPNGAGITNTI
eukprot:311055-Pelagomonas_calceolata.AAC.1